VTVARGAARLVVATPFIALALCCSPRRPALPEPGSYQLHDALEIHLFAAEPDVVDPVALAFDAAERMYVVEMRDYPLGMPPDGGPGGTIRLLEDEDRDGRADSSTVFAEGLRYPTSVAPWKGGVFVTAPPQILWLEDRDGDRRADIREVVFEGFTLGVTDSNVNGLRWALDNRIHGANGGNGGRVGETDLRGLDFRFDPKTRAFETTYQTAGGFGLAFDEWGRSFAPYNIDHLQQRIVPVRYLDRALALPPIDATANVSVHGAMARIFPLSMPSTRPNHPEQSGHYSAAGGIGWLDFEGEDLPRGLLVCDVVGNLVSREIPRDDGPVFATERAPEEREREFFASRDPAFRPIGVEMGPDGALYLIDMQRETIEHPDYIPESRRRGLDLRAGEDRGRIYRIVPKRGLPPPRTVLATLSSAELVDELASPSRWRRDTAQRLLYERADAPSDALRGIVLDAARPALARLHALWALQGLRAAGEDALLAALSADHAGLRESALRIAEEHLPGSIELRERMIALADDASPRVRFQAALSLGEASPAPPAASGTLRPSEGPPTPPAPQGAPRLGGVDDPRRRAALQRILERDADQRWSRVAVMSALGDEAAATLIDVLERRRVIEAEALVARELADLVGAGSDRDGAEALASILRLTLEPSARPLLEAVLAGLASGIARATQPPDGTTALGDLLDRAMEEGAGAARSAWEVRRALGLPDGVEQQRVLAEARGCARDRSQPIDDRLAAVDLLALGSVDAVGSALIELLDAREPSELQAKAIRVLASLEHEGLGRILVDRFRGLGPAARGVAIGVLLRRPALHGDVVAGLEDGRLTTGELHLDLEQRRRLLRSDAAGVAERAAKLVHDDDYGGRAAVVESWLARLPAAGSRARGKASFQRLCAQCHTAGGEGHSVGPDFGSLAHRGVEDLVSNILDPDHAIHPDYVAFEVVLRSGDREIGLIAEESASAITLVQAGGERRVIAREQVTSLGSTGHSLMPAGLEQGLDPQGVRDLVAFIQLGAPGDGAAP
jgi:putative membrane-bound dehydrogenase-like protein